VAINVAIIVQTLANGETHVAVAQRYTGPDSSRWIDFLHNFPSLRVDLVKRAQVTRAHPEVIAVPRERLWGNGRRVTALSDYYIHSFYVSLLLWNFQVLLLSLSERD